MGYRRQQDCVRNSISMTAQSLFSHKELNGVNTSGMQDLCMTKGVNWNDQPDGFKRGRMITKEIYKIAATNNEFQKENTEALRSRWAINPAIWITKERELFTNLIPKK